MNDRTVTEWMDDWPECPNRHGAMVEVGPGRFECPRCSAKTDTENIDPSKTETCVRCGASIQYVPQVNEWRNTRTGGDRCHGGEFFGYNTPPHTPYPETAK